MGILSAAAMTLAAMPSLVLAPTPAPSATAPPAPVRVIQLASEVLPSPIVLSSATDGKRYEIVNAEVSWLASRPGVAKSPKKEKLGPKVTVVVSVDGTPREQYDLYPLAEGGPRAYRPAAQPDKHKVSEGWFYGRLSMPAALRNAGVPLGTPGPYDVGGVGGGAPAPAPSTADLPGLVQDWQRSVAATGGLVAVLAIGIFFIAFQIRRRV